MYRAQAARVVEMPSERLPALAALGSVKPTQPNYKADCTIDDGINGITFILVFR